MARIKDANPEYNLIIQHGITITFHAPENFPRFVDGWQVSFGWMRLDHSLRYSTVIRLYESAQWEFFENATQADAWLLDAIKTARKMPRTNHDPKWQTWPLMWRKMQGCVS